MSLEFRHPPFLPFIAFLALPQYCLSSPMTTAPCDLLRSHRETSACLWLCLHRLETLIGYTPTHHMTIPVLAHIKPHHSIGKPCDRPLMSQIQSCDHQCPCLFQLCFCFVSRGPRCTAAASALLAPIQLVLTTRNKGSFPPFAFHLSPSLSLFQTSASLRTYTRTYTSPFCILASLLFAFLAIEQPVLSFSCAPSAP